MGSVIRRKEGEREGGSAIFPLNGSMHYKEGSFKNGEKKRVYPVVSRREHI